MKHRYLGILAASTALGLAQPALAAIQWTDWTSQEGNFVSGHIGSIFVNYSGDVAFAQTSGGTDYWSPGWNSTPAPPPPSDIIATNLHGLKTISFSSPVTNIYLAINSWNGQSATFSAPFTIASVPFSGTALCGYWGCGTPTISNGGLTINSIGETHGILKFTGIFSSLSFTDTTDEYWHGIQVGIDSAAVPEASTWAMMLAGFGLIGVALRRRTRTTVRYA